MFLFKEGEQCNWGGWGRGIPVHLLNPESRIIKFQFIAGRRNKEKYAWDPGEQRARGARANVTT